HLRGVEALGQLLRSLEHAIQPRGQLRRREFLGGPIAHAEQRRVAVRVPAVHDAVAEGDAGRPRNAEALHLLAGDGVGLDVDRVELDPPRREQLLRLGAGGSAGAGVQARFHGCHYRPRKGGGVFLFANAVTPALKSSVRLELAMACASSSICVSRLSQVDWWKSRLAAPKAFDGPCASSRASVSTAPLNSASGTTRVMRPHSSASRAVSTRLVK